MDIAKDITIEDMASIRLWLLQENQRLEYEREEFEREKRAFERAKNNFEAEKKLVQFSLQEQSRRIEAEKKSMNAEKRIFDQKLAILENGFKELCRDREQLMADKDRINKEAQKIFDKTGTASNRRSCQSNLNAEVFFSGVDNMLALKKRYRDLLKIFHPDNLAGDNETVQLINREYALLKQNF